jgi:hypothetical protein
VKDKVRSSIFVSDQVEVVKNIIANFPPAQAEVIQKIMEKTEEKEVHFTSEQMDTLKEIVQRTDRIDRTKETKDRRVEVTLPPTGMERLERIVQTSEKEVGVAIPAQERKGLVERIIDKTKSFFTTKSVSSTEVQAPAISVGGIAESVSAVVQGPPTIAPAVASAVPGIVAHAGGVTGDDTKLVDLLPKLQSGLDTSEFLSVLKKGETVFTPGQMKALGEAMKGEAGGLSISVPVTVDSGMSPKLMNRLRGEVEDTVKRFVRTQTAY